MNWSTFFVLVGALGIVNCRTIPCLDGCQCEQSDHDPVIRCDSLGLTKFPLPHSNPLKDYHFLALTCNDIPSIPSISMIKASFPDIQGIDVQGNPRLNCTELKFLESEIPVLSDCDNKEEPLQCDMLDQNCDWKCRALEKLKEMWYKFKELIARKAKDWQAEEAYEKAKAWFTKQFNELSAAFGGN